ncbi:hypothetical protein BHE74_00041858 [Ensete ventricosum]|nr:hypothetical protein BHE74_00041858 [Ensete ventricosum]RZS03111.1 hypothetical protein BHM03_00033241 [Ensete ventricosum]
MKNVMVINFAQIKFRLVFHAPSSKFKILVIPNVLAHGKSYEHDFIKKCDGHKHCTKSCEAEFQSVFRALSPKLKMLAIPNILAQVMSYEHGFMKKSIDHKLCAKSCAKSRSEQFFCTVSKIKNTS